MKKSYLAMLMIYVTLTPFVQAERQDANNVNNQIERGHYLAIAGDCTACHTTLGGKSFAGGLAMPSPIGDIYSTNITPDRQYGIGDYSLEAFDKAIRQGIARDGRHLYPAMPYPSFSKINDEDINDLYAYFMHGVTPIAQANKATGIPWPLSMRWPLAIWDWLFLYPGAYLPDLTKNKIWNRGAYLVQGLGHCGACHTPRGIAFEEKALNQSEKHYLAGGSLEGWHAINLNGDDKNGLGRWSPQEIIDFLQRGHNRNNAALGSMAQVIEDSTQYLTKEDLVAIAAYLKSLAPIDQTASETVERNTYDELANGITKQPGSQLYLDNCAACHRSDGKGYANTFPALDGNTTLNSKDPSSIIHVIITGARQPITQLAPTGLTMPDFGWRLDNEEIAELATFIRNAWSNQAIAVDKKQVSEIRNLIEKEQKK